MSNLGYVLAKGDGEEEGGELKETVCRWEDCTREFKAHEDLVKVT